LAVPLIAFANAEGGTVVVGIHGGRIEDVAPAGRRLNEWRQASIDFTTPPVRARYEEVDVIASDGRPGRVLVIQVEPGETVHEHVNGDCYLRVGDESRKLSYLQRQELHYDRGSRPYDGEILAAADISELDPGELDDYDRAVGSAFGPHHLLRARGLIDDSGRLTVAALLLFGTSPQQRLPHAHVRVLRYGETKRGTGSSSTVDADRDVRVEGSLSTIIARSAELVELWIPRRRALGPSGRFEAVPIVPRDAWLEGLVNAVVHRSYSMAGDHARIEIFPDRIEIESPGRFPGLVRPDRPLEIRRYARNPRIARVLADLNYARELGEGIRRMFDEMRERGLTDPMYEQTGSTVRLTLTGVARIPVEVIERLPKSAMSVMAILRQAGHAVGTGDVVDATGLSRPTVTKALQALRHEGLVRWDGRSPRDPRATWEVQP
jgi:ATP-dependent DNA helicase RecG